MTRPDITSFFHKTTNTVTHVAVDPATGHAAIIDPVLDYCAASGRTSTQTAEKIAAFIAYL